MVIVYSNIEQVVCNISMYEYTCVYLRLPTLFLRVYSNDCSCKQFHLLG